MNISIQGEIIAYQSDYSATSKLWKIHLRDAFRMVTLGSTECFVKRFASKPRAWDFMVASKGKKQTGLPVIHDALPSVEEGKAVYYLFLEKIEGTTLHDLMKDKAGGKPSVSLLGKALTAAFRTFHSQGYWHADFCAKNIMVATGGRRYVVIDLDSLEPVAHRPTPSPNEPGYIPDQELALYALNYVQSYIEPKIKSFNAIQGPALNYLQLIFLLDKLTYFSCVVKAKGRKFRELAAFNDLPQLVHRHLGGYTDQLVKRILDRTADSEMVITQPAFFEKELPRPQPAASLLYFKASSHSVLPGQSTQLTWEVIGASSVHITHLGTQAAKGSVTVPHSSGLVGEQIYLLTASGDSIKLSVKVDFVKAPPAYPPLTKHATGFTTLSSKQPPLVIINTFAASSYAVKEGERAVIDWDVSGAGNVYITNIGTVPAKGSKTFYSGAFSGRTEFALTAGNPSVKRSFFVEFPAAASQQALFNWNASQPAVVTPVPALPVKSKTSIWPFLVGFGLILILIGFWLQNRSVSSASLDSTFIPNQERGLELFDQGQYDSSFVHLVNFRDDTSHHFATQYNLAIMYDFGKGTAVNDTMAVGLYYECLRSTTPTVVSNALYYLGMSYLLGEGCTQDIAEARKCLVYAVKNYNNEQARVVLQKLDKDIPRSNPVDHTSRTVTSPEQVDDSQKTEAEVDSPAHSYSSEEVESSCVGPTIDHKTDYDVWITKVSQLADYTRVDLEITPNESSQSYVFLSAPGSSNALYIKWAGVRYELKKTTRLD